MASQMVNFLAFMVLPVELTFTTGTFTWTTSADGLVEAMEAAQAPPTPTESTSTIADLISGLPLPSTRQPLSRYRGRHLDNTDLVKSIDRVTTGLAETLNLVDSIIDQSTEDHRS
jgi:hypothetical protein